MKNSTYAVLALTILLGSVATAQKAVKFEHGNLALEGCYALSIEIYCDFNYRLTDKNSNTLSIIPVNVTGITETGASVSPAISFNNGKRFSNLEHAKADVKSDTPIEVTMYFNLPSNSKTISIAYSGIAGDNLFSKIPARPYSTLAPVLNVTTEFVLVNSENIINFNLDDCHLRGDIVYCCDPLMNC